jgi:hypothetical protein
VANDLTNFIPAVWTKQLQSNFDQSAVFPALVNTKFEGEIKSAGDTVHIRGFGNVTTNDYTRDMTIAFEDLTDPMTDLTIDQQKYFAFKCDDLDKAQADIKILEGYTERGAQSIAEVVDLHLHAKAYTSVDADNIIGLSGSPITLTKDNVYSYMVQLRERLRKKNAPMAKVNVVINPAVESLILQAPEFIHATDMGDKVLRESQVGRIAQMNVHVSNNLNAVSTNTPIVAFTPDYLGYAGQVSKVETVRPSNMFADAVKGLYLYGSVVPENHDGNGAVLWVSNA